MVNPKDPIEPAGEEWSEASAAMDEKIEGLPPGYQIHHLVQPAITVRIKTEVDISVPIDALCNTLAQLSAMLNLCLDKIKVNKI